MRSLLHRRPLLFLALLLTATLTVILRAEQPGSTQANSPDWPQQVVVTVGDIRTRIDGPKLWTLSGIDFHNAMLATQDSAYGTVLTIRNVGHLGTAHFLDVPGRPGEVEKEQVHHLEFFIDDRPVKELSPKMNLEGASFRMERRSKIRSLDLDTTITLRNGILTETARFKATAEIDLQVAYPWMYAWTPKATHYIFGDDQAIIKRGTFSESGKPTSQVVKNATWMALFDPTEQKGSVCRFTQHPTKEDAWFLLVDAPGYYRKLAGYTLENKVVPANFEGAYQSAATFFTGTSDTWETKAQQIAAELRRRQPKP